MRTQTLAFLLLLAITLPAAAAPWPTDDGWTQYGGSPDHRARSDAHGPGAFKEAATRLALPGPSFSSPVMTASGHLYIGSERGATGGAIVKATPDLKKTWTAELPGKVRSSPQIGPDGTVYITPIGPHLHALDPATGKERWNVDVGNEADDGFVITAAPTWHPDGFIVQPAMDGIIYGIKDKGTAGEVAWRYDTTADGADKVVAAAAVGTDGTIYVGGQNGYLYALTPAGQLKWKVKTEQLGRPQFVEQQVAAPAVGDDGTVYVGTRVSRDLIGGVYAFRDAGDRAERRWFRQLDEKVVSPVAIGHDGDVYVGDIAGSFFRLKASDGTVVWRFNAADDDPSIDSAITEHTLDTRTLSIAEQALVDAAGRVYVSYWHVDLTKGFPPQQSFRSPFYALDTKDGKIVWRALFDKTVRAPMMMPSTDSTASGAAKGILYLATDSGQAVAVGDAKPVPRGGPVVVTDPAPTATPTPGQATPTPSTTPSPSDAVPDDGGKKKTGDSPGVGPVATLLAVLSIALFARRLRRR